MSRTKGATGRKNTDNSSRHTCFVCGAKRYIGNMENFTVGVTHYACKEWSKGCKRKCAEIFTILNGLTHEQIKLLIRWHK